jgi:hypothetical protein
MSCIDRKGFKINREQATINRQQQRKKEGPSTSQSVAEEQPKLGLERTQDKCEDKRGADKSCLIRSRSNSLSA